MIMCQNIQNKKTSYGKYVHYRLELGRHLLADQDYHTAVLMNKSGLVDWPLGGQITRFWLLFFLLGLEKKVLPFGFLLASFHLVNFNCKNDLNNLTHTQN